MYRLWKCTKPLPSVSKVNSWPSDAHEDHLRDGF